MPFQNPFSYSYPGMQNSYGGQQQPQWQWGGQSQQQGQPGNFNPGALSNWGSQPPNGGLTSSTSFPGGVPGGIGNYFGTYNPFGFGGMGSYGGGTGYQTGPYPYTPPSSFGPTQPGYPTGENPAYRPPNTGTNTGGLGGGLGGQGPTPSTTPVAGGPATGYNPPTTPTYTANPVTDPNLAGWQSWGQSGGAPTLIPSATASFLGYGTAPPGTTGYNPNTGQWEF